MKMHFLSGGRLTLPRAAYYPNSPENSWFELPVITALLRHKQGNIMFDTGCHPDAAIDSPIGASSRWAGLGDFIKPLFKEADTLPHQLTRLGLTCDDIDAVVCSHLHIDHCGCNSFFPKATIICHADELAAVKQDDAALRGYFESDWNHDQVFQTVNQQHDVFGDNRITLIPAAGHTAGMMIARVELDQDGPFVLASDAVPVANNMEDDFIPLNSWDDALTLKMTKSIAQMRERGNQIIFGHDDAQWQTLRKGDAFYS
jgi:N-acyl homoserine lactone hydrolase